MENLLFAIKPGMTKHYARENHDVVEGPALALLYVEVAVISEAVTADRVEILSFVVNIADAVDVDDLVVE